MKFIETAHAYMELINTVADTEFARIAGNSLHHSFAQTRGAL